MIFFIPKICTSLIFNAIIPLICEKTASNEFISTARFNTIIHQHKNSVHLSGKIFKG